MLKNTHYEKKHSSAGSSHSMLITVLWYLFKIEKNVPGIMPVSFTTVYSQHIVCITAEVKKAKFWVHLLASLIIEEKTVGH